MTNSSSSPADVLLSFLEYRANFRAPVFRAWQEPGVIASALFGAFAEWQVGLDNVVWRPDARNAAEVQISCELLNKRMTFSVGLGGAALVVASPSWSEAALISRVAQAGMGAVCQSTGADIQMQLVTLAMHVKPRAKSLRDLTAPYVRLQVPQFQHDHVKSYGFSIYREDGSWVVDRSVLYPESLFLRMDRVFTPDLPLEALATVVGDDQNQLFRMLGLSVD